VEEAATNGTPRTGATSDASVRPAGVSKHFASFVAVAGVDLDVGRGEFFSPASPSRSGRS
jgi:hypothetical protein